MGAYRYSPQAMGAGFRPAAPCLAGNLRSMWVEKTNYFTVEVYGAQARSCAQYLGKGSRVFVDAELGWREWTDPDDKKREAVTFRARQVLFEGARSTPAATGESGEQNGEPPSAPVRTDTPPVAVLAAASEASASADDLPF